VGANDGLADGDIDGVVLGSDDKDGFDDGALVGNKLGTIDGVLLGASDGVELGFVDGSTDGILLVSLDGDDDGAAEGENDGVTTKVCTRAWPALLPLPSL